MVVRKRLNIIGPALVFVTTTVVEWLPILTKKEVADIIISELNTSLVTYDVSLISYVIMPSHFHGLLGFRAIENLSKFMQCFKGITSKEIKKLNLAELNSWAANEASAAHNNSKKKISILSLKQSQRERNWGFGNRQRYEGYIK